MGSSLLDSIIPMHRPLRFRIVPLLGGLAASLLLAATIEAEGIDVNVTCPASVAPGESFPLEVRIRSRECQAIDVRLISSLVGNAADGESQSGTVGVLGPEVVGTISVPPATDLAPPGCVAVEPAERTVTIPSAAVFPVPVSFSGVQAQHFMLADVPGTTLRDQDRCAIVVPEPATGVAGIAALLTVFFVRRFTSKR